jgi:hypothetical protein
MIGGLPPISEGGEESTFEDIDEELESEDED